MTLNDSTINRINQISTRVEELRLREEKINQTLTIMDLKARHMKKREIDNNTMQLDELVIDESLNVNKIANYFINILILSRLIHQKKFSDLFQ